MTNFVLWDSWIEMIMNHITSYYKKLLFEEIMEKQKELFDTLIKDYVEGKGSKE